ncbi:MULTISPECIES: phage tail tape measure protein [Peribacillus]|uniref:phage tail tape measure protein n=1 Tax=Peribacillus TaxID=2675229 RepID=UPI001F4ED950|nr:MULTISPECIES: phage tail tape measure protein [unclassified Peribacillus]MCK1985165.1 phage tail tape measure protein [Peribacillus sp. Aquil_B1]MCK2007185.1 phage tail tape measure protein [Peribacillus sp. Aquil_B8]
MSYELTAILRMKDQMSSQIRSITSSLKGLSNTTNQTRDANGKLRDEFGRFVNQGGRANATFGAMSGTLLGLAGAAGAVGVAMSSVNKAMDFESQMSSIKALTGASGAEMKEMTDLSLKMGTQTKYSALEAAQGIEELLKAGLTPAAVKAGGLESALNLATAGGLDLAKASEIMSTALNSFKDDALSAEQASNILAGTANASATSVEELQYGLSQVSSVAAGIGMSFQDTNTALGLFANNGLKGSDAGTSLKTMLSNLQPKTKAQTEAFFDLGLMAENGANAFFNAQGELKSLSDISGLLQKSMKGMTDQQRMSTLETLFGSDAIRAANILYAEGTSGVKDFNAEMSKVTALDVAKEKMNNAAGAVEQFKGALETLQISVLTPLLPVIKDGANAMSEWVSNLKPETIAAWGENIKTSAQSALDFAIMIKDNWGPIKETVISISAGLVTLKAGLVAMSIIETVTTMMKAYRTATVGATTAQALLNGVLFANPIGLVVAALALLVAGGVYVYRNWDKVKAKTLELWNKLGVLKGAVIAMLGPFAQIAFAAVKIYQNFDTIKSKAGTMVNSVISNVNKMIGVLNKIPGVNIPIVPMVNWGNITSAPEYSASRGQGRQTSHAGGLSYVPKDGYGASLHKGEAVLTKQENKEYRSGRGGATYNFTGDINVNGVGSSKEAAQEIMKYIADEVQAAGGAGA